VNRQQQDLRLFEFGKTYHLAGAGQNYEERELLALIQVGEDQLPHWQQPPRKASIFSLRRTLEQLQQWLGTQAQVTELGDDPELAYGLSFRQGRHQWARLGQVKPELVKQQGLQLPVFYACIDWPYLSRQHRAGRTTYQPLPKYPAVQRDLSMVVQPGMGFAEIARLIQQCDRQRIQRVDLFDLYQPKGSTERSYAVRIQLQDPNQTLQDAQVQQVMDAAIQALESTGKVQIRRA
jgi:phenylalanyl-tRNA synthetase beta chain